MPDGNMATNLATTASVRCCSAKIQGWGPGWLDRHGISHLAFSNVSELSRHLSDVGTTSKLVGGGHISLPALLDLRNVSGWMHI